MSETQEESLQKIPVLGALIRISQRIKLPGLNGLSLYELLKLLKIALTPLDIKKIAKISVNDKRFPRGLLVISMMIGTKTSAV